MSAAIEAMEHPETTDGGSAGAKGRQPISDEVKLFVWRRDGGACVRYGSRHDLEFDHIIPVAMGGSSTARNLQLLCEPCNRKKGGQLVPGVDA